MPNPLPKNEINSAPVYPIRAEISNLIITSNLAISTGFRTVNTIEKTSKG
jgi:hypothetical protein